MSAEVSHRPPRGEIHSALEEVIDRHFEGRRRLKGWHRRISLYSSSYPIENLRVELDRGVSLPMVLKDLSPASVLATAQRIRPHFLYHPHREIRTYCEVLAPLELGTATCYGAIVSPERGRYWLFLERVKGPLLWQVGRREIWREAARWLAGLHGANHGIMSSSSVGRLGHLERLDEGYYFQWLRRAEEYLQRRGAASDARTRRRFRTLVGGYDELVQRLMRLPVTLVHGEFYPSNIMVRRSRPGQRICPIDWELAAVAPGALDLAALTSGGWTEDDRRAMIRAYHESLVAVQGSGVSFAELLEAVDCCRLHLSIQLLGWASDWSPPAQHAQNWLEEAFRLVDRLSL